MVSMIYDSILEEALIAERRETGADRYDEVWNGVYVMAPMANNEHQDFTTSISHALYSTIKSAELGEVFAGVNVSDQRTEWTSNYRCPDVAVFLNDTKAVNRDTHWYGGPDFAVEIISANDRSREKLEFYAKVGTRELLLVDRDPWALELYRLDDGKLKLAGKSTPAESAVLASEVVPLTWQLVAGDGRPQIRIVHIDGRQEWTV